jgi:FMN phosphatase YigB (HAD superfamily)
MVKAIALDFGNVISEPHDTGCYARMAALAGLEAGYFMEAFWRYRPAFDRGSIRGRRMYREVLADAGVKGSERELDALADSLLDEDLASWFRISRPVTEWALSLQETGFRLGILSNMPFDFMQRYGDKIELFRKADAPVFSCYLGQIKPEPAIYRSLVERLGCGPEEIVFFDDLDANVRGGLAAGLRAHLWEGLERAKEDWEREVRAGGAATAGQ